VGAIVALQIATLPVAAVINLLPALGEEVGWRGWLLPKLMPLGTLPALLVSGVIWGLWHAPVILLGYNYPDAPGWLALTAMVGMCTVIGAVFGWLRLRSGSVWPAALAHAAFNGAAGSYLLFARAGEHVDTTQATVLGWSGGPPARLTDGAGRALRARCRRPGARLTSAGRPDAGGLLWSPPGELLADSRDRCWIDRGRASTASGNAIAPAGSVPTPDADREPQVARACLPLV
jgi:hypothetical protein